MTNEFGRMDLLCVGGGIELWGLRKAYAERGWKSAHRGSVEDQSDFGEECRIRWKVEAAGNAG